MIKKFMKWFHRVWCLHIWQYSGTPKTVAEGVWRIYNESPIRQGRAYSHYGTSLETIVLTYKIFDGDKISVYPESRACIKCPIQEVHVGNGVFKKMVSYLPTPGYGYCYMEDEIREG